ncbi:MAG: VOC family protein [Pseudomonadota bacterium]|nr:VOC family protein [Pseudomonadota bacterium]
MIHAGTELRVVRPTDDLAAVRRFYVDALGLPVIAEFRDHDGFDGLIVGISGAGYHLAFTRKHGWSAGRAATPENLLVFRIDDTQSWQRLTERMARFGHAPVPPHNPWWSGRGLTYEDPDGYRVVLVNAEVD